ncbi:hypothetical protein AB838_00325 [Rhodobacteraceae bacterium (ex Bugula neritina AB1)]|nr:hypothetical protein AB838_00325 [Rhodobacteraceae bacterium (ex Bugula neritina AB1)]
MALAACHTPWVMFDVTCIDYAGDHVADALLSNLTNGQVFGVCGLSFKEPPQLCLAGNATRSVSFQPLLYNRGHWFITDQQFAVGFGFLIAIADRCSEHRIAVHHPPLHAVVGLFSVLLPLVLCN